MGYKINDDPDQGCDEKPSDIVIHTSAILAIIDFFNIRSIFQNLAISRVLSCVNFGKAFGHLSR